MPEPDLDFLIIGFDAVALGVEFAPSLVSESILQDVRDGAFFPMVFTIGIGLGDVGLYVVARLERNPRRIERISNYHSPSEVSSVTVKFRFGVRDDEVQPSKDDHSHGGQPEIQQLNRDFFLRLTRLEGDDRSFVRCRQCDLNGVGRVNGYANHL